MRLTHRHRARDAPGARTTRAWRLTLTLSLALAAGLCASTPALALSQRGHTFCETCTFGTSGEGGLSDPGAVAVSQSTGDVYVLDRGHDRIVRYAPDGEFLEAWGWGVESGASKYQTCKTGCRPGIGGRGEDQVGNEYVMAIAVDNCTAKPTPKEVEEGKSSRPCTQAEDPSVGDVYMLKEYAVGPEAKQLKQEEEETDSHEYSEYAAIDKFSSTGTPLEGIIKAFKYEGGCTSGKGKPVPCEEDLEAEEARGLTTGPDGTVWLQYAGGLYPLSDRELDLRAATLSEVGERHEPLGFGLTGEPAPGLAVDSREHFYVGQTGYSHTGGAPPDVISEWETIAGQSKLGEVLEGLDGEDSTAVAANQLNVPANEVDEENDVYITNVKSLDGSKATTVAQFSPGGKLVQRFTTSGLKEGAGVAVDPASGAVYVTDAEAGDVDVFTLEEPGAPTVDDASAQDVTAESAQLEAQIDPSDAETSTTYAFRYAPGAVPTAAEACTAPCVEVPEREGEVAGGWSDKSVSAYLQKGTSAPLQANTQYRYRVIARNKYGVGEWEGGFRTSPETSAEGEADGRVWEMVSPSEKNGAEIKTLNEEPPQDGLIQAAPDGDAITYVTGAPVGEAAGSRSFEATQMLATRNSEGWSSQDIVTPNEHGSSLGAHIPSEYQFFSEDLSLSLVAPFRPQEDVAKEISSLAEPPLSPPVSSQEEEKGQERTIYVRDDRPITPVAGAETTVYREAEANGRKMEEAAEAKDEKLSNPGYLALLTDANVLPGAAFGGEQSVHFIDANPDLTTSVIELEAGIAGAQKGLYEWSEGRLEPVTVPPCEAEPCADTEPVQDAYLGDDDKNLRHAISNDGSRIFWSGPEHLYMRATKTPPGDPVGEETIQLDKAHGGGAVFQAANAEGSRVFFTDTQPLTPESGQAGTPDLYVCEIVENPEHRLECKLSDLTPKHTTLEGEEETADVQGTVLGASEEGTDVYFVANGVLSEVANAESEKAQPGLCGVVTSEEKMEAYPEETCNLYADHYNAQEKKWEEPKFIAVLSAGDSPDWESSYDASTVAELDNVTSRVSPNGRYLAFMSQRPLTSFDGRRYDNDVTTPAADNAAAEEVYLYDAGSEPGSARLVCASCEPSGARPRGVFDPNGTEAGHEAPLVDRTENWRERWLAGSIPGWTRVGLTGFPFTLHQSRYLSNYGRLFFNSPERLVPGATNGEEDVYEYEPVGVPRGAHECTSASATYDERMAGCIGLISSGTATGESAFLDASEAGGEGPHSEELEEGGGDVFFVSAAKLVPQEKETTFSLYDAHECTGASPCILAPEEQSSGACETAESCRPFSYSTPSFVSPASGSSSGQGNVLAQQEVLSTKTTKSEPRAGLARALKVCRSQYKHSRKKRISCEKHQRKLYGAHKTTQAKKKAESSTDVGRGRRAAR